MGSIKADLEGENLFKVIKCTRGRIATSSAQLSPVQSFSEISRPGCPATLGRETRGGPGEVLESPTCSPSRHHTQPHCCGRREGIVILHPVLFSDLSYYTCITSSIYNTQRFLLKAMNACLISRRQKWREIKKLAAARNHNQDPTLPGLNCRCSEHSVPPQSCTVYIAEHIADDCDGWWLPGCDILIVTPLTVQATLGSILSSYAPYHQFYSYLRQDALKK